MATSALSDLTKMPVMPKLPKTAALTQREPTPKGMIGGAEYGPVLSELGTAKSEAAFNVGQADIAVEKAKREEKATEAKMRAEELGRFSEEVQAMPERATLQQAREEMSNMAFVPTKDNATDLAAMFSLINIVGMLVGKSDAQRSMYAMNGMLEGYQKGRADLYKKEQIEFDKNFKAMQAKVATLEKGLAEAMEVKKYDKEKGDLMVTMALAQADSPVLKAMASRQGVVKVQEALQQVSSDLDKVVGLINKNAQEANRIAEATERERRADERARLAREQALALANAKAQTKQEGKTLTSKQAQEIEGLDSIQKGLGQLQKDFKPEFAGLGIFGFGADMEFEARRRLGDKKAQEAISWWSRYERFQAPNRHALFGATLTGNELKNYQSFTAKKSDSAETIKTLLQDQISYSSSVGENKKLSYEGAGYKVPDKQPREFVESFSTQPSKYSVGQEITQGNKKYRVIDISNPDDPEVEEIK